MKELKLSIFIAALFAMLVGCTKDFEGEQISDETTPTNTQTLIFKSPTDNSDTQVSSKMAVESDGAGGFAFAWEVNDVITIYKESDGSKVGDFTCDDAEAGTFTGSGLTDQESYIAVYPQATSSEDTLDNRESYTSYNSRAGSDKMTQDGTEPTHLRTHARMKTGSFTYTEGVTPSATFAHEMVYFAVTYLTTALDDEIMSDNLQLQILFEGGASAVSQYLEVTNRPSIGELNTLYFMVRPDTFDLSAENKTSYAFRLRYYDTDESSNWGNYTSLSSYITTEMTAGQMWNVPLSSTSSSLIYTEEELQTYSDTYATTAAHTGVLMRDITMTQNWTMSSIGSSDGLSGTFDGNGKTITNLSVADQGDDYVGMFNRVNGGTIKNLTLKNPTIQAAARNRVGAFTGQITATGSIINCSVEGGSVNATGNRIGGVAGENIGLIEGCYNSAEVYGAQRVGGITGNYTISTATDSEFGMVTACINEGVITSTSDYAGGVIGAVEHNSDPAPFIIGCINRKSVNGGGGYVGGIVGQIGNNSYTTNSNVLKGCYNEGSVSSATSAASRNGVVGNRAANANYDFEANYYLASTDTGSKTYDGVISVESLSEENITAMNYAISTYGYKYETNEESELLIVATDEE